MCLAVSASDPDKSIPSFSEATLTNPTQAYRVKEITPEEVLQFRERHYDKRDWLTDTWDKHATHYGYFIGNELAGVLRVVKPVDGKLPVSSYIPGFQVQDGDCQIGRLLVAPEFRGSKVLSIMLHHFTSELVHSGSRVILTPRELINISPAHFQRWGFTLMESGIETAEGLRRKLYIRNNADGQTPLSMH